MEIMLLIILALFYLVGVPVWLIRISSRLSAVEKNGYKVQPVQKVEHADKTSQSINEMDVDTRDALQELPVYERATAPNNVTTTQKQTSFEEQVGVKWLQWLGISALIVALLFFLKWSFDNGIIGETGRTVIGYILAAAAMLTGDYLRKKHGQWALTCTGGGALAAYIVTWVAFNLYGLFPAIVALNIFACITLIVCVLAGYYNAKPLAVFGILGALLTPLLAGVSTSVFNILIYILIVNIGVVILANMRQWRDLHLFAFVGTILWEFYALAEGSLTFTSALLFIIVFTAIYLGVIALYNIVKKQESVAPDIALLFLNCTVHFGLVLAWLDKTTTMRSQLDAVVALVFAIVLLVFSTNIYKVNKKDTPLVLASLALTVLFSALAIPLQFGNEWVPIAWSLEAVFLLLLSLYLKDPRIQRFAWPVMIAAYIWYLVPINSATNLVNTNIGFGLYFVWAACFIALAVYALKRDDRTQYHLLPFAFVGTMVLLLALGTNVVGATWEATPFYERLLQAIALIGGSYVVLWQAVKRWKNLTDTEQNSFKILGLGVQIVTVLYLSDEFTELIRYLGNKGFISSLGYQINQVGISILWALYATATLFIGFIKKLKPLRMFGMILLLIAIAKLTLIDSASLATGYRVIGFTIVGALLVGASFLYQKNSQMFKDLF